MIVAAMAIAYVGLIASTAALGGEVAGAFEADLAVLRTLAPLVVLCGAVAAFVVGGEADVSHLVLRCCLSRAGLMPLRYARFLDHASERILMRRVGGGYTFVHRLVQEHFQHHESELIQRLSKSGSPQPLAVADPT